MRDHGVLQEIRDLLALGKPSREVIEMGYAPGSVYKAQRQLRKRVGSTPFSSNALSEATGVAPDEPSTDRGLERVGRLEGCKATLLAIDGSVTGDVHEQVERLPTQPI